MTQAQVDPVKLREFAQLLRTYCDTAQQSLQTVQNQLARLGTSWRDREYERFRDEMRKVETQMSALRGEMGKIIPVMERDAASAEEIHRDRL